ncbi:MAG TPA: winged helix-turn-helix domain-containing protein [Pyrinomonadaceae bacterium]|nr:winged helix-turn-helix domain-containing protein [Pyrinomonadaceae bacterium]
MDTARRLLLRGNESLPLTPRIFDTLVYLVENQGRMISKEELMKAIWPNAFVEENNLTQSVSALRRILGERRGENRYIVTVPGHGYRFAAIVKKNEEVEAVATRSARTIAVLPFKPLVEKHRDEALELGMADALIIRLSTVNDFVVRPLTSVRRYFSLNQDAQVAGEDLDVESVLDGNIQRAKDRIRVTARLINVSDGASLWVGTFDEEFTDVFSVQDAISERVAEALKLTLTSQARHGLTRRYTDNTSAYELYLQGRYHWSKLIPPEVRVAIKYFEQAIEVDPNYALAYTGMAVAYVSLPISCDARPEEAFPSAKHAAVKALTLDESLPDAHAYLAFVNFWFDWNWDKAESEIKRGLALNPNSAEAHRAYGILLSQTGRIQEAIQQGTRARELDPLSLITRTNEALFYYFARDYEAAQERIEKTLDLEPGFWVALLTRAKIFLRQGKFDQAVADLIKAKESSGGSSQPLAMLAYLFAIMGRRTEALGLLHELEEISAQRYVPPYNFALTYFGLQDDIRVFEWLERAYQLRDVLLAAFINNEPWWDELRDDKRFQSILERMGLQSSAQ